MAKTHPSANNFFKIRSKTSGLYSNGKATYPSFQKKGKVWQSLGLVRAHLSRCITFGTISDSWEVVEIELTEKSVKSPADWIDPKKLLKLLAKEHYD